MKRLNDGTVMGGWWEISSIQLKSNQFRAFVRQKENFLNFFYICTIIMNHDLSWLSWVELKFFCSLNLIFSFSSTAAVESNHSSPMMNERQ